MVGKQVWALPDNTDPSSLTWRRSPASSNSTNLEIARFREDACIVRDSNEPSGPFLVFTIAEWQALERGITSGVFRFDDH